MIYYIPVSCDKKIYRVNHVQLSVSLISLISPYILYVSSSFRVISGLGSSKSLRTTFWARRYRAAARPTRPSPAPSSKHRAPARSWSPFDKARAMARPEDQNCLAKLQRKDGVKIYLYKLFIYNIYNRCIMTGV